jgi:hypothetical protein
MAHPVFCKDCGQRMLLAIDEGLGRMYWCPLCSHTKDIPFDGQQAA